MPLPFTALVVRREPNNPLLMPERHNARVTEQIVPDVAPDPVRESDVWAVGLPPEHAYSRQTIAIPAMAAQAYHAVMADNFGQVGHVAFRPAAGDRTGAVVRGGQMPYRERINIVRNPPEAYGSTFVLDPTAGMGLT